MMKSLKWLALVALVPTMASAALRNSRHDLSSGSTAAVRSTAAGTDQICIFCHTPHNAASTNVLWNRSNSTWTAWTWGATTTTGGTTLPVTASSLSSRCLACHDGSVALGTVLNSSGGPANFTMTGPVTSGYRVGAGGSMAGHHPVGVPYATSTYNAIVSRAIIGQGDYFPTQTGAACTGSDTGNCTVSSNGLGINITLFGTAGAFGVECISCHDVHNAFTQTYFLRASNSASGLCLSCHNK
jgi:predicted CXXCH cytochrome family protein